MQNPIQKIRQNSIVFEKPGMLSESLKTLTSSDYPTVQYFLLILCTRSLLTNIYKIVSWIFIYFFRSWVINKNVKDLISVHSFFTFSLITQDLNKIKKIPDTLLVLYFLYLHYFYYKIVLVLYGLLKALSHGSRVPGHRPWILW